MIFSRTDYYDGLALKRVTYWFLFIPIYTKHVDGY